MGPYFKYLARDQWNNRVEFIVLRKTMQLDTVTSLNDNDPETSQNTDAIDLHDNMHINPQTYLATDYLNHFNEIVMMAEMLPELPDVYADIVAWEPVSYVQHFQNSGFAYADLAVRAYEAAPQNIRQDFDALISDINQSIIAGRQDIVEAFDQNDQVSVAKASLEMTNDLRLMIDTASAMINGTHKSAQDQADSIFDSV